MPSISHDIFNSPRFLELLHSDPKRLPQYFAEWFGSSLASVLLNLPANTAGRQSLAQLYIDHGNPVGSKNPLTHPQEFAKAVSNLPDSLDIKTRLLEILKGVQETASELHKKVVASNSQNIRNILNSHRMKIADQYADIARNVTEIPQQATDTASVHLRRWPKTPPLQLAQQHIDAFLKDHESHLTPDHGPFRVQVGRGNLTVIDNKGHSHSTLVSLSRSGDLGYRSDVGKKLTEARDYGRSYVDIGHGSRDKVSLFYFDTTAGHLVIDPHVVYGTQTLHDELGDEAQDSTIKGRIDHTNKKISLSTLDALDQNSVYRAQRHLVVQELREKYPDYTIVEFSGWGRGKQIEEQNLSYFHFGHGYNQQTGKWDKSLPEGTELWAFDPRTKTFSRRKTTNAFTSHGKLFNWTDEEQDKMYFGRYDPQKHAATLIRPLDDFGSMSVTRALETILRGHLADAYGSDVTVVETEV